MMQPVLFVVSTYIMSDKLTDLGFVFIADNTRPPPPLLFPSGIIVGAANNNNTRKKRVYSVIYSVLEMDHRFTLVFMGGPIVQS